MKKTSGLLDGGDDRRTFGSYAINEEFKEEEHLAEDVGLNPIIA